MKILTATQIKDWDKFTIENEPIPSIDLMERAASGCVQWIDQQSWQKKHFRIFCGKGNNGGDGLCIARLLHELDYSVSVHILEFGKTGSPEFQTNLQRLHDLSFSEIYFLQTPQHFPSLSNDDVVVDAIYGSGLRAPLEGLSANLVEYINATASLIVSIDLPTGLFMDQSSMGNQVVRAVYTLTFQCYKLALLMQENAPYFGIVVVLDIGLHPGFLRTQTFQYELVHPSLILQIKKPRDHFAHKGRFGHVLLIAGSFGKMGAAVLAARACIHSGAGLLTCFLPRCGYQIMQTSVPEAMVITDENERMLATLPDDIEHYDSIGIGPGIGTTNETQRLVSFICKRYHKPLVIDADGINCLSLQKNWNDYLTTGTILTPHPKEFDRLFGSHQSDFERLDTAKEKSRQYGIVILIKSHHTIIVTPGGYVYFNSTGGSGMAKGGSGDVLTGLITSLLAQGYTSTEAAILGVYLHGLAGDMAAQSRSEEAMSASDIIEFFSAAFLSIKAT